MTVAAPDEGRLRVCAAPYLAAQAAAFDRRHRCTLRITHTGLMTRSVPRSDSAVQSRTPSDRSHPGVLHGHDCMSARWCRRHDVLRVPRGARTVSGASLRCRSPAFSGTSLPNALRGAHHRSRAQRDVRLPLGLLFHAAKCHGSACHRPPTPEDLRNVSVRASELAARPALRRNREQSRKREITAGDSHKRD